MKKGFLSLARVQAAWWESALLCRYDLRRWELLVIQQNLQEGLMLSLILAIFIIIMTNYIINYCHSCHCHKWNTYISFESMTHLTHVTSEDIFDVLPAVKWCVLHEDFQGDHKEFIGDLQPHLQALVVEATELLELCIRAPYARGTERESMNRYIQESAFHVQKLQHFLAPRIASCIVWI